MQKRAFSLIELLIVIVIIGVVYTLAITNMNKLSDPKEKLTLLTLKEYLLSFSDAKRVKLLCLDDCSNCDILADNEKVANVEDFLDDSVKSYRYESAYGTVEKQKEVYFNLDSVQERVCFSYEIEKNGVGDQVIIAFKNRVYDFTPYLTQTLQYDSLEEAVRFKRELREEVLR